MKQNAKTVLVQLAIPINAHQNANKKPIGSAPAYRVQCTLPPYPIYQTLAPFRFFEGLIPRLIRSGQESLLGILSYVAMFNVLFFDKLSLRLGLQLSS